MGSDHRNRVGHGMWRDSVRRTQARRQEGSRDCRARGDPPAREKKYEDFVTTFLAPDDFKKLANDKSLREFADQFGNGPAATLLQVLRAIEGKARKSIALARRLRSSMT